MLTRASRLPPPLAAGLSRSHLPSLDGLRAGAALAVVFYHYGFDWAPGGLAVLAFFVLSGFLITCLLLKEEERFGAISLQLFYVRRGLRIFSGVFRLLDPAGRHAGVIPQTAGGWPGAGLLLLFQQLLPGAPRRPEYRTQPHRSLAIEEQFYLLWPLLFLRRRRNRRRIVFLLAAIVAVWTWREALVFLVHRDQGYIYEAFDTRADHLMTGCLLAMALREGGALSLWRRLCAPPFLVWTTLGLLAVSTALGVRFGTDYRDAVGFAIDPFLVAALIVQAIAWPQEGFARLLNSDPLRYLGTTSYSFIFTSRCS